MLVCKIKDASQSFLQRFTAISALSKYWLLVISPVSSLLMLRRQINYMWWAQHRKYHQSSLLYIWQFILLITNAQSIVAYIKIHHLCAYCRKQPHAAKTQNDDTETQLYQTNRQHSKETNYQKKQVSAAIPTAALHQLKSLGWDCQYRQ